MSTAAPAQRGLRTFQGAVAIVTGGGSGIGAALGRGLVERGARVILADRDEEGARAEAARASTPDRCEAMRLDVRDAAAFEGLVDEVFRRHGRLDYLFNNAGVGVGGAVENLTLDDWRYGVDVNLMGPVHGVLATWPRLLEQGFGHVVNTASMAAYMATAFAAPYGATKHAILGLSRALRVEGADRGVRVSVLCPGVIRTPILENAGRYGRLREFLSPEEQRAAWERLRPMDVDAFAGAALAAVARNRGVIVIPWRWRVFRLLNAVSPALGDAIALREYRRVKGMMQARTARRIRPE